MKSDSIYFVPLCLILWLLPSRLLFSSSQGLESVELSWTIVVGEKLKVHSLGMI